jgi:signal transduction histidine kinase
MASPKGRLYRRRLRSRIIVSFVLLGTALTAAFAVATVLLRERLESQLIGEALQQNVQDYAASFRRDPASPGVAFERIQGLVVGARRFANVRFDWRNLDDGVHDLSEIDADGDEVFYKLAVRKDPDAWFFLRYDTTQDRESQERLQWALIGAVAAFSLASLGLGIWSSHRVMQPVADLAARLRGFSQGAQPEPLAPHFADDEVGQLAAAFDDYAERLTALVRRDREFNADVSHELRTPLAVIRGATELLQAQPELGDKAATRLKRIERAVAQCTDLIEALLTLSRSERGHGAGDLRRIVGQIVEAQRLALRGKSVELVVEEAEHVVIDAPESVLSVALGNLIGNAVKYTPQGTVHISIHRDRVEIADSGPGIASEDAARLFERGVRGKSSEGSKGAGIGLAIVSRLCELYGWSVALAPRADGESGAVATLRFSR